MRKSATVGKALQTVGGKKSLKYRKFWVGAKITKDEICSKNMMNNFQIKSLQFTEFHNLFDLDNRALEKVGAIKMIADKKPGFPCRVSLQDAEIGEEVILLSYQHHQANSPYQSSGPIFIRKNAGTAMLDINEIPQMLVDRLLSIRAYDIKGMMQDAVVSEGGRLKEILSNTFNNPEVYYVHIHNAKPGCYNCKAERV